MHTFLVNKFVSTFSLFLLAKHKSKQPPKKQFHRTVAAKGPQQFYILTPIDEYRANTFCLACDSELAINVYE